MLDRLEMNDTVFSVLEVGNCKAIAEGNFGPTVNDSVGYIPGDEPVVRRVRC